LTCLRPAYVEAWNNLANVLAESSLPQQALQAFERALDLLRIYADALVPHPTWNDG
jgi:hypothetical protein